MSKNVSNNLYGETYWRTTGNALTASINNATGIIKSTAITANKPVVTNASQELVASDLLPAITTPDGAVSYYSVSIIDQINEITPDGYSTIFYTPVIANTYTTTNVTTSRTIDANAMDIDSLADVVSTLIEDLKAANIIYT